MEGKAVVVTMSRDIGARLFEAIRALRPAWDDEDDERGAIKFVVTGTSDDPEPLRSHVRAKAARKRLAERFKDPADDLRLVMVCDMWLTGFDCPPAHTMYLDKPLAGHNLMQAIARVNRVYGDKPGGLIVDLLGLADQLADAVATYTLPGGTGEAVRKVQGEAVPAMPSALEKLRSFFHGCDYGAALAAEPREVLPVYLHAIDHVLGLNEGWQRFRVLSRSYQTAFALAVPRPESEVITPHLAFFQRAAAMIRKRLADDGNRGDIRARQRDIDAAVRQVIGGAVDADEVIDPFAVAGPPFDGGRRDAELHGRRGVGEPCARLELTGGRTPASAEALLLSLGPSQAGVDALLNPGALNSAIEQPGDEPPGCGARDAAGAGPPRGRGVLGVDALGGPGPGDPLGPSTVTNRSVRRLRFLQTTSESGNCPTQFAL